MMEKPVDSARWLHEFRVGGRWPERAFIHWVFSQVNRSETADIDLHLLYPWFEFLAPIAFFFHQTIDSSFWMG